MQKAYNGADLAGRFLLVALFLISGVGKIAGYAQTQAFMQAQGVPGWTLPLVILTEVGGSILIAAGLWTRAAAFALGGFSMLAALIFHTGSGDQVQQIMFLKDVSIAGAFLLLVARGAGEWSVDARIAKTRR